MRLANLSVLIVLLLAAAGCSDLPSADETTAGMNPDIVITLEGNDVQTRYSAEYLRKLEVQREANRAIVIDQVVKDGGTTEGLRQYQAYVEARRKVDDQFATQIDIQRERVDRSWEMAEFDPTLDARGHRREDTNAEYIQTLLDRYNVTYDQLRQPVPPEFQSGNQPAAPASGAAADPSIPSEFLTGGAATGSDPSASASSPHTPGMDTSIPPEFR